MFPEEVHKRNTPIVIDKLCGYIAVLYVETKKHIVVYVPRIFLAIRPYLVRSLSFLVHLYI